MANDTSTTLSTEDANGVIAAVGAIRAKLPFLVTLPVDERRRMAKLGHKSVGFDEKCAAYMKSNPEFLPGVHAPTRLQDDRALREQLLQFSAEVGSLAQQLDDTLTALSANLWAADLAYYRNVRAAARGSAPAAKLIAEDLASRFTRQRRSRVATVVPPVTPAPAPVV